MLSLFPLLVAITATAVSAIPLDSLQLRDSWGPSVLDDAVEVKGDHLTKQYSQYGALKNITKSCVVQHSGEGQDDTPNLLEAVAKCGSKDVEIVFEEGILYNIYSPFQLKNLSNVHFSIKGNLQFSEDREMIQKQVANITAYATYGKAYMQFTGQDVTIQGSKDSGSGWLNCFGQKWWDIETTNYTNNDLSANRPQTMAFDVKRGSILDLKIYKQIAWNIALLGEHISVDKPSILFNISVNNTFIWGVSESTGYPFNTDGVNVKSEHTLIENSVIYGGDDCVAIVSGAQDLVFRDAFCRGTHGLSIGSLGKDGANSTVEDVLISDVRIEKSTYAARFKSWVGGGGHASNISWVNIEARQVIQPIFVTTSYYDQQFGKPKDALNQTTKIIDFTFKNFWGDIDSNAPKLSDATCVTDPCWNYVEGADGSQVIILQLDRFLPIDGIKFENVHNFVTSNRKTGSVLCNPDYLKPADVDTLGFQCLNGPLVST
ncbi:Pectin lyase fold/virulence factor [Phaffia rhodozyma]|uniref:galacturonan 1,4-alpha-galacturonidase n=1 Tax=Phaffia rhodozyma TaxID=264483 RepID=A0A0F7STW3_PHARH|nr:Pectin lyase fold/virulence factor [Phaffia rhodozyma]